MNRFGTSIGIHYIINFKRTDYFKSHTSFHVIIIKILNTLFAAYKIYYTLIFLLYRIFPKILYDKVPFYKQYCPLLCQIIQIAGQYYKKIKDILNLLPKQQKKVTTILRVSQKKSPNTQRGMGAAGPRKSGAGCGFRKRTNFRSRALRSIPSGMQNEFL